MWCRGMDWIDLTQDGVTDFVNTEMNLRIPYNAMNFLASWEPISFSHKGLGSMELIT